MDFCLPMKKLTYLIEAFAFDTIITSRVCANCCKRISHFIVYAKKKEDGLFIFIGSNKVLAFNTVSIMGCTDSKVNVCIEYRERAHQHNTRRMERGLILSLILSLNIVS